MAEEKIDTAPSSYSPFARGDLNGFWALFADNLANLVVIVAVCRGVFAMPAELVFGRILPGAWLALLAGLAFYALLAIRLGHRERRSDVTALPYGISTPIMFVYLFGVIGPVYWSSHDPVRAWQVGVAAAFIGGLIEASGALLGPLLKSLTPRAGMLGTLAGIALVWIATVPLAEIFEHAAIGFPALAIILVGLVAGVRLPGNLPAGLAAILLGTIIGLATGEAGLSFEGVGLYLPSIVLHDLAAGLQYILADPSVLTVVVPLEIYNFIETMNNVESAEAAGDRYDVRTCQFMDGLGTLLGSLFGSPFPTTVYIGHPAYKQLGARAGYALLVGLVFFCGNLFGLVAFLHHLIPVAAAAPMLVFVGLVICAQAFRSTPPQHAAAVAIAMIPHVSDLVAKKLTGLAGYLATVADRTGTNAGLADTVRQLSEGLISDRLAQELAQTQGIHLLGQQALSRGAILTGLIWGALTAMLIDRRHAAAAWSASAGLLLALFGFIHSPQLGFHYTFPAVWGYGLMALLFALAHCCSSDRPGAR